MGEELEKSESALVEVGGREDVSEHDLLRRLIRKGILELKPVLDKDGIRYADVEKAWSIEDSAAIKDLLEHLERKGLLKSRILERVLICPNCASPEVHSKYACPRCGSYDVGLTELLEHVKCGHIGARSEFVKEAGLVCPSCHVALSEERKHYRVIGNFYECEKCKYRFDKPEVMHICQKCSAISSYQEAKYVKLFSYRIAEETVKEFAEELPILDAVQKLLRDRGFEVKLHQRIVGASGVQSEFDVWAEKGNVRLVVDVSLSGDKKDIIALLAKKVDTSPTKSVILDLSGGNELGGLGKVYDIIVFKVESNQNVPDGFEAFLDSLIPKTG